MLETIVNTPVNTSQPLSQRQGANPLIQTARGKLQTKRSKLNNQINREIQLRNGAEKLLRAMEDKKVKIQVALELSFFNSNIQLYKEELSDVNCNVGVYQFDSETVSIPMLPLGLKETKDVNFKIPFVDFIHEHYSEIGENYENEIQQLSDMRQAIRAPSRDSTGIRNNLEYFNQLYFVERRFFSPERKLPIFFHWYDSLTGIPDTQRSVAYERACVMYNVGALYTQIACKQDHTTSEGLGAAINNFQLAAGTFQYIRDFFNHAPSTDMQTHVLSAIIHIMLSQAQECIFERTLLGGVPLNLSIQVTVSQEASMLSKIYTETHKVISNPTLSGIIPVSWVSMIKVKQMYYTALSHYYFAVGLLDCTEENGDASVDLDSIVATSYADDCVYIPADPKQHNTNGKSHLRQALILHGEALRDHETCKHLRKIDTFKDILQLAHDRTLEKFEGLEVEDDFSEVSLPQNILPQSQQISQPVSVDVTDYAVADIFRSLGPLSVFNARNQWTSPRLVTLTQTPAGYGFSVSGHAPVIVAEVDKGSCAHLAGLKTGDVVIAVHDHDTKWSNHDQVVQHLITSGTLLKLKLITPIPHRVVTPFSHHDSPAKRASSVPSMSKKSPLNIGSPDGSVYSHRSTKSAKWLSISKLFSRQTSKSDKSLVGNSDVMLH